MKRLVILQPSGSSHNFLFKWSTINWASMYVHVIRNFQLIMAMRVCSYTIKSPAGFVQNDRKTFGTLEQ